ncbi:MAG: LacI family DNA-binding transcriptional regulator [Ardenticatenaceae bacterium]|nr:LacI family DNA-binding transcriptional regulator [Ardenticatenaceae bacterium]
MSITIEDISKHLNISVSTVSKALNGYTDVSSKTKERVAMAARELGYQPSAAARNLRRQRTDKIGFVFNNSLMYIGDYFAEIIVGATSEAESQGNNIVLYTNEGDSPASLQKLVRTREVDGFVLVWNHVPAPIIDMLLAESVPFVILGRRVSHPAASFIAPDNYQGALQLMQHLYNLGHRRIGFTTRPSMAYTNEDRFNAYKDFLTQVDIPVDPDLIIETKIEPRSGYQAANRLLDLPDPPTAIFAFHDYVAIDAHQAILDRGLRIPHDVALAGFDGLRTSLITSPPITTVRQPLVEIGRASISALLTLMRQGNHAPIQQTLPVKLQVRQSTAG